MPSSQPHTVPPLPALAVKGVVTFFYYEDQPSAVKFYQQVVGLRRVQDFGWCTILQLQPSTYLGLVNAVAGSQRPIAGANKGAILSIETADLDGCLAHMKRLGVVAADTILEPGCAGHAMEFKIRDPGGYTVEFFRWL